MPQQQCPSKEQILLSVVKGIQSLAYDSRSPARNVLDRIRITCKQTLDLLERTR